MQFKPALNIIFGIATELLYVFSIMLAALLICLAIYLKI